MKKKWTDEECDRLVSLWESEASVAEIRAAFPSRSKSSIWTRACNMGLGSRHESGQWQQVRTPERVQKAAQMRAQGAKYEEIAASFGLRSGTIIRCWIDPKYAAERKEAAMRRRRMIPKSPIQVHSQTSIERKAAELAKLVPPDTRDLTARIFGDPLPGRRAIDKMEMQRGKYEVPFQ